MKKTILLIAALSASVLGDVKASQYDRLDAIQDSLDEINAKLDALSEAQTDAEPVYNTSFTPEPGEVYGD